MRLLARALAATRAGGSKSGLNVVAFSGGVDSSLVAKLVHMEFPQNSIACIGLSAALPKSQLAIARDVASSIGITLREVATKEGEVPEYIANSGRSCFYCKSQLYTTLQGVADEFIKAAGPSDSKVVMYNGTNADDRRDPTRLGLVAADNFSVASPLAELTKDEVREVSQELGLPNWNFAASPCLRSRLALNVEATAKHLAAVESAEEIVRLQLGLTPEDNLRVRMLAGRRVAVEVDNSRIEQATVALAALEPHFEQAGLPTAGGVQAREFKTGSVSGYAKIQENGRLRAS